MLSFFLDGGSIYHSCQRAPRVRHPLNVRLDVEYLCRVITLRVSHDWEKKEGIEKTQNSNMNINLKQKIAKHRKNTNTGIAI